MDPDRYPRTIMAEAAAGARTIHSRSIRAGYQPDWLFAARALVVGAGALGQNLLLDLGLAGVGHLFVVDFDRFERHNATRSPLYPSATEQDRLGLGKAKTVAHKLRPMMTAPVPTMRYAEAPIEALGDAPFAWADIVFAAVDSPAARAYLANRCRLHGRPLVEAGFDGAAINLAVFGPGAEEPCWLCSNDAGAGAFSCTRYALAAEQAGIIPAIQNAAAVLAGLQAEAGIMWLHGDHALRGKVVYGNVRSMQLRTATLSRDPACPGIHRVATTVESLPLGASAPLATLLEAIHATIGPAEVRLPAPLILRIACQRCGTWVEPCCPEWRWLLEPRCTACGGSFPQARTSGAPAGLLVVSTKRCADLGDVAHLSCLSAGLPPATTVEVWPDGAEVPVLLRLTGTLDDLATTVGPAPSSSRS